MDKAKAAVSDFLHKDGKHSTTVHEVVNPAVQREHVTPTRHENVTTAVDKEVHQHHHHTTVQPVHDREVLPEKHTHNLAGVEHREFQHGNHDSIKPRLEAEAAQFKNTREVHDTKHTNSVQPTVGGEHTHHHIHENIQPVIQKETIQPNVVHTTVPIHEVHHNEPKHHTATSLPAVSMEEFKRGGGVLTGRGEHHDAFEGKPRDVGEALTGNGHHYIGGHGAKGTTHLTDREWEKHSGGTTGTAGTTGATGHRDNLTGTTGTRDGITGTTGTTGATGLTGADKLNPNHKTDSVQGLGEGHTTRGAGVSHPVGGAGAGATTGGLTGSHTNTTNTTSSKPSLLQKLNPLKDADGDGKKGFMD